jgi:cytoskeletal protein RodZ
MNRKLRSTSSRTFPSRTFTKCLSIGLLTGAFLISSEMPLLASPSQDSQSNSNQNSSNQSSSNQNSSNQSSSSQTSSSQTATSPTGASQAGTTSQKPEDSLPDAPQATPQTQTGQQEEPPPSGTAGAKAASVKGAPVAQPAGAAVAPARQHGHRSLLIKLGLLAGAGAAVGAVVALSAGSRSRPPGASPAIQP